MIQNHTYRFSFHLIAMANDRVALPVAGHLRLARGDSMLRPVGLSVDRERACPADSLAAVVRERDRLLSPCRQLVVHDVEHLEEGHVGVHALTGYSANRPGLAGPGFGARRAASR